MMSSASWDRNPRISSKRLRSVKRGSGGHHSCVFQPRTPAVPDDEVDHPDQPEELQRVPDDERLADRPAARERLLEDLPDEEEVPARDGGAAHPSGKPRD